MSVTKTGMIGLGAMGLPMARHMKSKGFEVCGIDIDKARNERAAAEGIRIVTPLLTSAAVPRSSS